jgi:hypothetical protein
MFIRCEGLLLADDRHSATLRSSKHLKNSWHQRTQIVKTVASRYEYNNRYVERREVLLIREIAVRCKENVELPHGQGEQFAISFAGPTHLWRGSGLVPCELAFVAPRKALVK